MSTQLDANRLADIRERVIERSAADMPERVGRYQIRGELGRGGMGIVYDAYDERLDRAVALKVVHPEVLARVGAGDFSARFEREMRATSGLFHPNLVSILDAGIDADVEADDARAYYVMERVVGPSLEERLLERGRLTRDEVLETGAAIARGLAVAHGHGLVHRDLKASNVLLPLEGEPKVSDFGLCNVRGTRVDGGAWLGSAHSMAPEQIRCEQVDASADLFALGSLLVRACTGAEPFRAGSLESHFYRVLHDEPDGIDELDPDLRRLATRLLAKKAEDRPRSAAGVAEEMKALRQEPERARAVSSPPRRHPPTAGRGWIAGVAVALLLAVAAGLAIYSHNELVELETEVSTRWKQVENQLARQNELIPRLLEVTERHVRYENEAIDRLNAALARYRPGAGVPGEAADLQSALLGLLLLADQIPSLGADEHFQGLAYEIAGTKNRIAVERARYNEAVGRFNRRLEQLPWRFVSGSRAPHEFFSPPPERLSEPALEGPSLRS